MCILLAYGVCFCLDWSALQGWSVVLRGGVENMGLWGWMKANFFPFHIFLGYVFVTSGLVACFLMLLAYIFIWPFSKTLYRKIVIGLAYSHWCRESTFFSVFCFWVCPVHWYWLDPVQLDMMKGFCYLVGSHFEVILFWCDWLMVAIIMHDNNKCLIIIECMIIVNAW